MRFRVTTGAGMVASINGESRPFARSTSREQAVLNYPGHGAGLGLLLLRVTLGVTVAVEGSLAVTAMHTDLLRAVPAATLVVGGIGLTAGIFTPVCGGLVAAGHLLVLLAPALRAMLPDPDGADALIRLTAALALGLLGPGTYSIDSHLFGRREIFIPASHDRQASAERGDADVPCPGDSRQER